ncbi:Shedu anti-phage system protein SduA domain-containing protein [Pseudonocardia sp.]|uniref:Shedu anti-phage system protein SduA domain-containing protein n=1 Tax=Pseudonocardia sp. TaxID=60912 RepID=UPI003D10F1B3
MGADVEVWSSLVPMGSYIDLTDSETRLGDFQIVRRQFAAELIGSSGVVYKGFVLARSSAGNALTICDVTFHKSSTDGRYPPRLSFCRTDIDYIAKDAPKGRARRVSFQTGQDGYREFWQMIAFLYRFKEIVDLGEFAESYRAASAEDVILHIESIEQSSRGRALADLAHRADVDAVELSQILLSRSRRSAVEEFGVLLADASYRETYRAKHAGSIKGRGEEAIWHHFLSSNKWIFGLSLDLRFIEDFVDEASVGVGSTANHGNPRSDMLGWSDYTILVEIKTPGAAIFTETKTADARAGTWSFSTAFIEGISQCLAQRSSWEKGHSVKSIEYETEGVRYELDQNSIRTIDPSVIFIIGHKERELPLRSASMDVRTKRDTLERFSRNSRNVSIVTYDELFLRAYQIAHGERPSSPPGI